MFDGFTKTQIETSSIAINLVKGGAGPPLLLLHGYPQSHVMWHKVAPLLAPHYTVVVPDLRGYGDSGKPASDEFEDHCKRASARDQVEVMAALGFDRFHLVGHDRGARVGHRMALDRPAQVRTFTSLDVVASQAVFENMDRDLAFSFFHWHLMRQPAPFPETLIGNSPKLFLDFLLEQWTAVDGAILAWEMGPLAVFLSSDAAAGISGETIAQDGGGLAAIGPTGWAPRVRLTEPT